MIVMNVIIVVVMMLMPTSVSTCLGVERRFDELHMSAKLLGYVTNHMISADANALT